MVGYASFPSARMSRVVNRLQLRDRNAGVYLRRREIGVAQEHLDEPDIGSILEHMGRACMAKEVACAARREAGIHDVALHGVAEPVLIKRVAVVREEEKPLRS